jgi:hypothetical protein
MKQLHDARLDARTYGNRRSITLTVIREQIRSLSWCPIVRRPRHYINLARQLKSVATMSSILKILYST